MPFLLSLLVKTRLRFHRRTDAGGVGRIGLREVSELAFDDLFRHAGHGRRDIFVQPLFLFFRHQAIEVPGLGVIVVAIAMIVPVGVAGDLQRRFLRLGSSTGPPKLFGS